MSGIGIIDGFQREELVVKARNEGRKAQLAGAPIVDNPYVWYGAKPDSNLKFAWDEGYLLSEEQQKEAQ